MVAEGFNPRHQMPALKGWPTVSRHSVAKPLKLA